MTVYQKASLEVWEKKYKSSLDTTMLDTYKRVAKGLAQVEDDPDKWEPKFLQALQDGAIPAGRIMANVGALDKPNTSLINCTVSNTVEDSIEGILESTKQSGITLSAGCGIGYDFSTLRPKGAMVAGVGASTSGALSFMNIFDSMCFTISSAGGRRGAQMGTMDVSHPDIIDFIKAKREDGRFRQFNLSVLITEDFISAVKNDKDWNLIFPLHKKDKADNIVTKENPIYPVDESNATYNDKGELVYKIYKTIKAKALWDLIMKSTYEFAEPGFILIDKVNKENNNWWCEDIRTTNPCGEQPLPPFGPSGGDS